MKKNEPIPSKETRIEGLYVIARIEDSGAAGLPRGSEKPTWMTGEKVKVSAVQGGQAILTFLELEEPLIVRTGTIRRLYQTENRTYIETRNSIYVLEVPQQKTGFDAFLVDGLFLLTSVRGRSEENFRSLIGEKYLFSPNVIRVGNPFFAKGRYPFQTSKVVDVRRNGSALIVKTRNSIFEFQKMELT